MNFDEFEDKLRGQPRREIPSEWRREILAPLQQRPEAKVSWWRQLLWPHPGAWATLAAAWVAIFALNFAGAPEGESYAAGPSSRDALAAYQERQRLWAELALDLSQQPRKPMPAMDRPRSRASIAEVAV
jgi:hypothetical protein